MAKLKCDSHKRRVFAIGEPPHEKFVHRSDIGDGNRDRCDSRSATIGDMKLYLEKRANA